jgi:MinD superfamily P-loop ATPase
VSKIKEEAEKLSHKITLIDSAAGIGCPVIASLNGVDLVVAVTEPSLSGISDLKRALTLVNHFNLPFLVVINKWNLSQENTKSIEDEYGEKVIGKISFDKRIFKQIAELKPVLESNLPVKKELENIFNNLKPHLNF